MWYVVLQKVAQKTYNTMKGKKIIPKRNNLWVNLFSMRTHILHLWASHTIYKEMSPASRFTLANICVFYISK